MKSKKTVVLESAFVSWLTDEQKDKAMQGSVATISTIDDPFKIDVNNYPEPNFDYFLKPCSAIK